MKHLHLTNTDFLNSAGNKCIQPFIRQKVEPSKVQSASWNRAAPGIYTKY